MRNRSKKIVKTKTNVNSGEVTVVEETYSVKFSTTENYFSVFSDDISCLLSLPTKNCYRVLIRLSLMLGYDNNRIILNSDLRKEISAELKMSVLTFNATIKTLRTFKVLTGLRGTYIINPKLAWKGSIKARHNYINNISKNILKQTKGYGE